MFAEYWRQFGAQNKTKCTNRRRMQNWNNYISLLTEKKFAASTEDIFHFTRHHVTHVRTAVKTKNSAFPESYVFHIRTMSANLVEMLYLRICCVVRINFEIIFSDFYLMLTGMLFRTLTWNLEHEDRNNAVDKYVCWILGGNSD